MTYGIMDTRLSRLERQQAKEAAYESTNSWYSFRVTPSCPPDKRLYIRNGVAMPGKRWGWIINDNFIPDWVCNFEDSVATQLTLNFTNADYYLPIVLCYYTDWLAYRTVNPPTYENPVFDSVVGAEVETSIEAEGQIDAYLNGVDAWYDYRMPLWGIVLKNDGQTGVDYAILPVDAINRGRSYLYRDARAKNHLIA